MLKSKDSEARWLGFKSQLCHLIALGPQTSYLPLSVPQFPHLEKGDNDSTNITGLLWGF